MLRPRCYLPVLLMLVPTSLRGEEPLPQGPKLRLGTTLYRNTWAYRLGPSDTPILSPDARTLLFRKEIDESAWLDTTSGKVSRTVQFPLPGRDGIQYLSDGKLVAGIGWRNSLVVFDLTAGRTRTDVAVARYGVAPEWVVSADGSRAAIPANFVRLNDFPKDISVNVWSLTDQKSLCEVRAIQNEYVRARLSGDGKVLATWGRYKTAARGRRGTDAQEFTVQVWNTDTGAERCRIELGRIGSGRPDPDGFVVTAAVSPDGQQLAAATTSSLGIELFDSRSGKSLQHFASRGGPIRELIYSPDGSHLAALGFDGAVQLWDLKAGLRVGVVDSPIGDVAGVVFPKKGRAVAWGMDSRAVVLWEIPSGKRLHMPVGHTDIITSI